MTFQLVDHRGKKVKIPEDTEIALVGGAIVLTHATGARVVFSPSHWNFFVDPDNRVTIAGI